MKTVTVQEPLGFARFSLAARLIVGAVLAVSGYLKLMSPAEDFALQIEAYRLLPFAALVPLARALPWVELFVGGYLLAGYALRFNAALAMGLFLSFLAALTSVRVRGISLADCGCFGGQGFHLSPNQGLLFDLLLLGLSGLIYFDKRRLFSLDHHLSSRKAK